MKNKKLVSVNSYAFGSTGRIMTSCAELAQKNGWDTRLFISPEKSRDIESDKYLVIGSKFSNKLHYYLNVISGFNGMFSFFSTLRFLSKLKRFSPNVLHLHNLHNCYINLPLLFRFIKKRHIAVIWTLHDCWSFTGQCPHFTMVKCEKWKKHCFQCPQYKKYPKSLVDRTRFMYKKKKKWFTGIENMTVVTPSKWLAELAGQSFLKDYPIKVINNGIDLSIFKPTESDFRIKYNLQDKYIVLGVAFDWGTRKGLDVFVELSKRLDCNKYQIVLVGTDKKIKETLPDNIICIERTQDALELAGIYSAADLFVNPTREENYPTVNMEAIACGTPVLTFDTGGSSEIIDERTGSVVDCDDINAMEKEIKRICEQKPYAKEDCIKRANAFDKDKRFKEYLDLYESS